MEDWQPPFNELRAHFELQASERHFIIEDAEKLLFLSFKDARLNWSDSSIPHFNPPVVWKNPIPKTHRDFVIGEVLAYRLNRIYFFLRHKNLYPARIVMLMYAYVDTHIPLKYLIEKTLPRPLRNDWERIFYNPDNFSPCWEGALPNAMSILPKCVISRESKENRQPLEHEILKTLPYRCFVRWQSEIILDAYIFQQAEFDEKLTDPKAMAAAAARAEKVSKFPRRKKEAEKKHKYIRVLECETIPERNDIIDFNNRIVTTGLLGGYTHCTIRPSFEVRCKIYADFIFNVTRFSALEWQWNNEHILFYSLKEYVAWITPFDPALYDLVCSEWDWNNYSRSTIRACDKFIRTELSIDPETREIKSFGDLKGLSHTRKEQLKNTPRKVKHRLPQFTQQMLRNTLGDTATMEQMVALLPLDKKKLVHDMIIPRMRVEEGMDWTKLVLLGLSRKSMLCMQHIVNCSQALISESELLQKHLGEDLSPYAWGAIYFFTEEFIEFTKIRIYELPQHIYKQQIAALRIRHQTPPGHALPPMAGEMLFCPNCRSICTDILPPGTGTEEDLRIHMSIENGRLTYATRDSDPDETLAEACKSHMQCSLGPTGAMIQPTPDGQHVRFYCCRSKDKKRQNTNGHKLQMEIKQQEAKERKKKIKEAKRKQADWDMDSDNEHEHRDSEDDNDYDDDNFDSDDEDAVEERDLRMLTGARNETRCGQTELIRIDAIGARVVIDGKPSQLCCGCGAPVYFDLSFYHGDRYLCKFCQAGWRVSEQEHHKDQNTHLNTIKTLTQELDYWHEFCEKPVIAGLAPIILPEEKVHLDRMEQELAQARKQLVKAQAVKQDPLWAFFPDKRMISPHDIPSVIIEPPLREKSTRCSYCNAEEINFEGGISSFVEYMLFGGQKFVVCRNHNKHCIQQLYSQSRNYSPEDFKGFIQRQISWDATKNGPSKIVAKKPKDILDSFAERLLRKKREHCELEVYGPRKRPRKQPAEIKAPEKPMICAKLLPEQFDLCPCYLDCPQVQALVNGCKRKCVGNACTATGNTHTFTHIRSLCVCADRCTRLAIY